MYFKKLLEDHRILTNIDINEILWTGIFGANGTSLRFIYRNKFLYLETTVVNLLNVFYHKVFCVSFVIDEKNHCNEKLFHLCWTPYLAFLIAFWIS